MPCLSSAPRIPDTTGCHQGWSAIGRWTRRRLKSFLLMLDSDSACSQACPLGPDGQPGAWVWRGFLEAEDGDSFVSFGVQGPASCPRRSWETKGSRCHAAGGCPSTLPASPLSPACGCSWLPGALDEGDPSLCPSAPTPPPDPWRRVSRLQSLLSKLLLYSLSAKIPRDQTSPLSRQGGVFSREVRTRRGASYPDREPPRVVGTEPGTLSVSGGCSGPGMEGELESLLTWVESRGLRGWFYFLFPTRVMSVFLRTVLWEHAPSACQAIGLCGVGG